MGEAVERVAPRFVGVDPVSAPELKSRRTEWTRLAAAHSSPPSGPPDAFERAAEAGPAPAAVRDWLQGLRASARKGPAGPALPSLSGRTEYLPWLWVSAEGEVLCHWGRQTWLCQPPFDEWIPLSEDIGDARFQPGHRALLLPRRKWGVHVQSLDAPGGKMAEPRPLLPVFWSQLYQDGAGADVRDVACSPDGRRIAATVQVNGRWHVLQADLATGTTRMIPHGVGILTDIAIDPADRRIWLAGIDGRIWARDWDESRGRFDLVHPATGRRVRRMAFDPSGDKAMVLWVDGRLAALDLKRGERRGRVREWHDCSDIAYNPNDGTWVALMKSGQRARIAPRKLRPELIGEAPAPGSPRAASIAFSGTGDWYLTSDLDGSFRVWDAQDHKAW